MLAIFSGTSMYNSKYFFNCVFLFGYNVLKSSIEKFKLKVKGDNMHIKPIRIWSSSNVR